MSKCRQQKMYGHGCNFYLSAYYKYLMNSFYSACETSGIKQQQLEIILCDLYVEGIRVFKHNILRDPFTKEGYQIQPS